MHGHWPEWYYLLLWISLNRNVIECDVALTVVLNQQIHESYTPIFSERVHTQIHEAVLLC